MEDTKEFKVQAMQNMRQYVRNHIFGSNKGNVDHLGQLNLDKDDNTRLVISLQDLLEKTLAKKRRAEIHIRDLVGMLDSHMTMSDRMTMQIMSLNQLNQALKIVLQTKEKQIAGLEERLQKTERQLSVFKELFVDNQNQQKNVPTVNIPLETPPTKMETAYPDPFKNFVSPFRMKAFGDL